jgi:Family of unknown function (DUF6326)
MISGSQATTHPVGGIMKTQIFDIAPVNVRIKIAMLWTSILFIFAYVDIFSLYRPDFRADIAAGKISVFTITQAFLFGTTVYIAIPSLMIAATVFLQPSINRIINVVLSVLYAVTIISGAIGEWNYYVFGSILEVALLGGIAFTALKWPRSTPAQNV